MCAGNGREWRVEATCRWGGEVWGGETRGGVGVRGEKCLELNTHFGMKQLNEFSSCKCKVTYWMQDCMDPTATGT